MIDQTFIDLHLNIWIVHLLITKWLFRTVSLPLTQLFLYLQHGVLKEVQETDAEMQLQVDL